METFEDYREKAIKALQADFAHIKERKLEKCVDKYIAVAKKEILRYWIDLGLTGSFAYVRVNSIHRNAGRYQLHKGSKKQTYISNWLDKNCALYKICKLGNNKSGKLTEIHLNYDLGINADVVYAAINNDEEISSDERKDMLMMLYGDSFDVLVKYTNDNTVADITEVNFKSLKAYIDKTQYTYSNNKYKFNNKLKTRIKQAKRIYAIAKLFGGSLIQIINESAFGRKYYKGPNLQSVHKDVRHAALGDCIEFDIANSVYAWRYDLVKDINANTVYAETLNYLQFKKSYRERLAEEVFGDVANMDKEAKVKIIKQAFTAISFGAKGSVKAVEWNENGVVKTLAINAIITAKDRRKLFLNHSFVKAFIKEQEAISKVIFDAAIEGLKEMRHFKGKTIKQSEALAFLYQQNERIIMDKCITHIAKGDLLLVVHDAFYVKRINADTLVEIKCELADSNSELKLEREEHKAYTAYDYEKDRHNLRMSKEVIKAKTWEKEKYGR